MTREEAIKELTELLPEEFLMEYAEAIRMGIEALEQEPCEDCISREAVIKTITEWLFSKEFYYTNATEYLRKRLDELPPVTPQQEIGHWEWVQYDGNPNIGNWHCSKCRTIIPNMPEETDNTPIYKWCPMCGTKMQKARIKNECL